ncbi:MAG: hypothetical protein HY074_05395 [Deltaproteobacteria bacterium]|nr:hypothetical protein [Deltaproteobacteria bacterium]
MSLSDLRQKCAIAALTLLGAVLPFAQATALADGNIGWGSGGRDCSLRELLDGENASKASTTGIRKSEKPLQITISKGEQSFYSDTNGMLSVFFKDGTTFRSVTDAIGRFDDSGGKAAGPLCLLQSLQRVSIGREAIKFRVEMYSWDDSNGAAFEINYARKKGCPVLAMHDVQGLYALECRFESCEISVSEFKKIFGEGVLKIRSLAAVTTGFSTEEYESDGTPFEFEAADSSVEPRAVVVRPFAKRAAAQRKADGRF